MKRIIRYTFFLLLFCAISSAAPGWEKNIVVSPTSSFQPLVKLKNKIPIIAYEKKEADGIYLHVISMQGGLFEKFLLSQNESFHEYDIAFVSNTLYVVYTTMSELNLIIKDMTMGTENRSSLPLPNTHGPALTINPKTGLFHLFYIQIEKSRHGLYLLNTPTLDNAQIFKESKLLISENNTNLRGSFFPQTAFDDTTIHLAFTKRTADGNRRTDSIYLMSSFDDGLSWNTPQMRSQPNIDSLFPTVSVSTSKQLTLAFKQTGPDNRSDLKLMESKDNGANFTTTLFTNFPFSFFFPTVFKRAGETRLLAYDYANNNYAVIFEKTLDKTLGLWTNTSLVSPTNISSFSFKHISTDNKSFLTWQNNKGEIHFTENDTSALPPRVFSSTIDTNYEFSGNSPDIQWTPPNDPSGIQGFAYILDNIPDSQPDIENLTEDILGKSFNSINDGIWYFHIRTIDKSGNWSDPAHFRFTINNSPLNPPTISSPSHREYSPTPKTTVEMTWSMEKERRKIKGYSYLFTTKEDLEPEDKILTKATNMQFYNIKPGVWRFTIKACDVADNWSTFAQYMVNIEETILAAPAADYKKISETDFSEQESAITYTIKKGDILSRIINKVLGLKPTQDHKDYLKEIVKYNDLQNPDNIQPTDRIMIPILIADQETDLETVAESIFGTPKAKYKIVIQNSTSTDKVKVGDRLLIRDKYFLKTGSLRKSEKANIEESGLKIRTESKSMSIPVETEPAKPE